MVIGLIILAVAGVAVYRKQKKDPNSRLNRYKAKKAAKKNPLVADESREVEDSEVEDDPDMVGTSEQLAPPPYSQAGPYPEDEKAPEYKFEDVVAPEIPPRSPNRLATQQQESAEIIYR